MLLLESFKKYISYTVEVGAGESGSQYSGEATGWMIQSSNSGREIGLISF